MIGYLEVPKPSYPPYFDQLIERYQPLWENVLNNNFYWWDFHTQEGKVRISVRVVCISLRGSEHQEQQTGQPITINKQQTTPRTNTGSPGKCKGQARPSTLILALFWSLHGCQVRANFNEQVWTKLANIKQWICNHLNMKACRGYIMVSHSYVFCFIKWIIYSYLRLQRHSKSKLCDQILGSMPSDRPKPSPVEFCFNEEANYLDRLGGKKLIGLQLAKWVVTVAVGPQWQLNSVIR